MKYAAITATMAIGILSGTPVLAAGETTDLHVPPQTSVDVREWVVKNKPRAYRFKAPVVIGGAVPGEVETSTVPKEWGPDLQTYHYVYADNRVYLLDPTSRRVVYIID